MVIILSNNHYFFVNSISIQIRVIDFDIVDGDIKFRFVHKKSKNVQQNKCQTKAIYFIYKKQMNQSPSLGDSQTSSTKTISSDCELSKSSLPDQSLTFQQKLNRLLLQAQEHYMVEDFEGAIIKYRLLLEKINFYKQNKKIYDKKIEMVGIYNLAATFQKLWNLDECLPLLEKFISLIKMSLTQSLKQSSNLKDAAQNKYWFKLKMGQIRGMLQYCAILSQMGEHQKAFRVAIEVSSEIKKMFKRAYDECVKFLNYQELRKFKQHETEKSFSKANNNDKIEFSYNVLLGAKEKMQQLSRLETYIEIIENKYGAVQAEMQLVKSNLFYWKTNPENNIKMLRKEFTTSENILSNEPSIKKVQSQRNLLGVKKANSWIEQFTIAKVMFMSPLNYAEFSEPDNIAFQFNQRNLIEKVILLSVTYFSLSIQLRFLESQQPQSNTKKQQKDQYFNDKQKIQPIQKSEIFHLKSIQIVCKYIKQNSAFVSHLVNNYHKHYKINLNIIQQENSLAEYSEMYENKSRINSVNRQNLLEICEEEHKAYRKDSVYYSEGVQESPSRPKDHKGERKKEKSVFSFKKTSKKGFTQKQEKSQRSKKLASSTSLSLKIDENNQKDKTMKKLSSGKMMTFGKIGKIKFVTQSGKQLSPSKYQTSRKSIDKKNSISKSNNLKSSNTLKQNRSASPPKRNKSKDIKQSIDMKSVRVLKKKEKEKQIQMKGLQFLKKSNNLKQLKKKQVKIELQKNINTYNSNPHLNFKKKKI